MIFIRTCLYLLAAGMGIFVTVFLLTSVEAASPSFQQTIDRINRTRPKWVGSLLSLAVLGLLSYAFLLHTSIDYVRAAIFAGLLTGFPIYLRSGATVDRRAMRKSAGQAVRPRNLVDFIKGPDAVRRARQREQKVEGGQTASADREAKRAAAMRARSERQMHSKAKGKGKK